jgi:hypothetical protein
MYKYFNVISGTSSGDDVNLVYGGLNFAFRDFLAHLDRTNGGNNAYKTIIPTELNVTLDGIGGIIIGNLFKINEDIVPNGYKGVLGRKLAYIVTGLGHSISNNDWTTDLKAYPIVFEQSRGTEIYKQWKNQQYPGTVVTAGGQSFVLTNEANGRSNGVGAIPAAVTSTATTQKQVDAMNAALEAIFGANTGAAALCARYTYNIGKEYINALNGKPLNGQLIKPGGDADDLAYRTALEKLGYKQTYTSSLLKQQVISKIKKGPWKVGDIIIYYDPKNPTDLRHTQIYTGGSSPYSGGYLWASSYSDNYTYNFIYNNESKSQDTTKFNFYVYSLN